VPLLHPARGLDARLVLVTLNGRRTLMAQAYHTLVACRAAVEANIPCLTSLDTARALVEALRAGDEALCLPFVAYREG
jgi:hypothetical protein